MNQLNQVEPIKKGLKNMFGKKNKNERTVWGNLISGLDAPNNADIMFKLTPSGAILNLYMEQKTFEINISKITNVQWYDETNMEKILHQSAPGMIIGAAAFGLIGAMIGGRVKTKEVKTTNHFVIINYTSNEQGQITIKTNDSLGAMKIADYFKELKPDANSPQTITL